MVSVVENHIPEKVICSARAYPMASYQWRDPQGEVVIKGNALMVNYPMLRKNSGNYTCEAINRHGNTSTNVFIDVLCEFKSV